MLRCLHGKQVRIVVVVAGLPKLPRHGPLRRRRREQPPRRRRKGLQEAGWDGGCRGQDPGLFLLSIPAAALSRRKTRPLPGPAAGVVRVRVAAAHVDHHLQRSITANTSSSGHGDRRRRDREAPIGGGHSLNRSNGAASNASSARPPAARSLCLWQARSGKGDEKGDLHIYHHNEWHQVKSILVTTPTDLLFS